MSARNAEVTVGTEVTPQSPIVVNAVRDIRGTLKRKQTASREPPLYPGVIDDDNHSIMPGQLTMLMRGDDVDHTTYDSNYIIIGSANGLGKGLAGNKVLTRDQKKFKVRQELTFGGVARGMVDASKSARQGLAVQTGGTYSVVNTGMETLCPGDYVVWDVPEPEIERNRHISGQPANKMQFVMRSLQTELKRAGVTANRIRDTLFNTPAPVVSASRIGDHTGAAAYKIRDVASTFQLLGLQRYAQAKKLVGNVPRDAPSDIKDAADALTDAGFNGGSSIDKDVEVLSQLLGLTRGGDHAPNQLVQDYFSRYALGDASGGADYDFSPKSRMDGTNEPSDGWEGDMLVKQQNVLNTLLGSVMLAEADIRRRVIGKSLNFAPPGSYCDLMLGNFS